MAVLAASTAVSRAGVGIVGAAVGVSDTFANSGKQFLLITNGNALSTVVTVVTQATIDGLAITDLTVTIPTATTKLIGPFPPSTYNDASGYVTVSCSITTTVTILVLSCVPEAVQS